MATDPGLERLRGKFYGKYSGEVTDVADAEKMGRIKVKVPSVFPPDAEVYAWPCFPAMHFWVPPVGTKVWVEFEAGDVHNPIWTGVWFPVGTAYPSAALDPPDNRVIQTPSGHTVEFLDKEGEEKILVKHKGNAFLSIDKDGSVTLTNQTGSYLFLNAKDGEASLVEEHKNMISMSDGAIVVANTDGSFIELKGKTARVFASDGVQISGQKITLDGSSIALGGTATFTPVMAELLAAVFATHVHPTALGPSGPPVAPLVPTAIGSQSVKSS